MIFLSFFVFAMNMAAQIKKVELFSLTDVRLQDSPFKHAQDVDLKYILDLNADRLLAPFCEDAGIEPKAPKYGNWESMGLGGQTGGHYLTALSLMYQSTGNPELKRRIDYMVSVLAACQVKNGNGYVAGVPNSKQVWGNLEKLRLEDKPVKIEGWVPWYNLHKTMAGLRDAYLLGGNQQAKDVLVKLADWCYNTIVPLTNEQMETMLGKEHGGMNEVIADVYAITGDRRYLELAQKFSHKFILEPLIKRQDKLTNLHANTQIPKIIGFDRISQFSGDTTWHNAAAFFWETVIRNRTLAFGGNSVNEHFNNVSDYSSVIESKSGPETCNTYNMLRLTKMLYTESCDLKYIDFYERGLYNHILASQHPERGGFVYLTSIHPQHYRTYSTVQDCFWCCVGTGIENHAKYGELIYAHTSNDLYVNLFIPSTLNWTEKGITVIQETKFPEGEETCIKLKLVKTLTFKINIRLPKWAQNARVSINGINENLKLTASDNSAYLAINREWKDGDVIVVKFPMHLSYEFLPDHSPWISFLYGPIVLAAKTSSENMDNLIPEKPRYNQYASGKLYSVVDAPIIVSSENELTSKLVPVKNKPLTFSVSNVVYPDKFKNLELIPFFKLHDSRYMIYWQITAPQDLKKTIQKNTEKYNFTDANNARTIDQVSPGEQQTEIDHNMKSENSKTGIFRDKKWRDARGWFSYDFKDSKHEANFVQVTYYGKDRNRKFDVILNDSVLTTQILDGSNADKFFTETYTIPEKIKKTAKGAYTLKFKSQNGSIAGGVFNIVLLKK